MIPQEYIQEVVRRNDIEEVIGQYVQLRRRGRTATGLCPFHNEKTPSFVVYPDTQSFYCFGCGAAGDVINFVRKYNNLAMSRLSSSWRAAPACRCPRRMTASPVRASACWRSTAAPRATSTRTSTPKRRRRHGPPLLEGKARPVRRRHPPVRSWLRAGGLRRPAALPQARGFSEEELETSGLVKRSAKGNLYDIFRHRVMVPIIDVRGAIIAFGGRVLDDSKPKYINSPETMVYHKSRTLFALNIAKKSKNRRYILCEATWTSSRCMSRV